MPRDQQIDPQGTASLELLGAYSMVVAIIGAIVVLVIYHAVAGRRAY
jgi:uncharacterized membrane protein YeaQ/YmgE (transglycosylase-associated protein family)